MVCIGVSMAVMDATAVIVALPKIEAELGFTDTSFVWVLNAYLVCNSGFQLPGGRIADLFGHRRVFMWGLTTFTVASLGCAMATYRLEFLVARAIQGLAAAVVGTAALPLIVRMFKDPRERARAIGISGFAYSGAGIVGMALAGLLTSVLSWRWIFLINVLIGPIAYATCRSLLPETRSRGSRHILVDMAGVVIIASALLVTIYGIGDINSSGWLSAQSLAELTTVVVLLFAFRSLEHRNPTPLIPLALFQRHDLVICCISRLLVSVSGAASVFVSLYMQNVLELSPMQVGLAMLPSSLVMSTCAIGLSPRLVIRFGIKRSIALGLITVASGFVLLARTSAAGSILWDVLPSQILIGAGSGIAFSPMTFAALNDVSDDESGLISGLVITFSTFGCALWLAVLTSVSATHSGKLLALGRGVRESLNTGYHTVFFIGALALCIATAVTALLRTNMSAESRVDVEAS